MPGYQSVVAILRRVVLTAIEAQGGIEMMFVKTVKIKEEEKYSLNNIHKYSQRMTNNTVFELEKRLRNDFRTGVTSDLQFLHLDSNIL